MLRLPIGSGERRVVFDPRAWPDRWSIPTWPQRGAGAVHLTRRVKLLSKPARPKVHRPQPEPEVNQCPVTTTASRPARRDSSQACPTRIPRLRAANAGTIGPASAAITERKTPSNTSWPRATRSGAAAHSRAKAMVMPAPRPRSGCASFVGPSEGLPYKSCPLPQPLLFEGDSPPAPSRGPVACIMSSVRDHPPPIYPRETSGTSENPPLCSSLSIFPPYAREDPPESAPQPPRTAREPTSRGCLGVEHAGSAPGITRRAGRLTSETRQLGKPARPRRTPEVRRQPTSFAVHRGVR